MLTKLQMHNFKRFADATVELGQSVVLIGPNNMGKTTALQALAHWDVGLRAWVSEYGTIASTPKKRPGVTINRKDLMALPIPSALFLWKDLHVRDTMRDKGKQRTENVRMEIVVHGLTEGQEWKCGLEFDYANEASFYCRSLRVGADADLERMPVPAQAVAHRIAYLPPMSGLADQEFVKQPGEIGVLIGQGQTAQVLRNLCHNVSGAEDDSSWHRVVKHIKTLFGVELLPPVLNPVRSEITMAYKDARGNELDISCAGRGLQQTLLLLAYLYANPKSALLLDEPDAHLEILRQRQIFNLLTDVAESQDSQIIAASHSEVVLNEAANRGRVVAFVGRPHTINDKGSQLLKALTDIGFDQYYQAEQKGWILYLENTTDLDILRVFAETIGHPAGIHLAAPFLHAISTNLPQRARDHFFGLREAKGDLVAVAIFDRLEKELQMGTPLVEMMWRKREIENYFCREDVLLAYAVSAVSDDLFGRAERQQRLDAMKAAIAEVTGALSTLGKPGPWTDEIKASDDFFDPLFKTFSAKIGVPLVLRKNEYYKLARFVSENGVDAEIKEKLNAIMDVASKARLATE
jgi:ABC-type nitrate/sulfonate/bicarbonate transport system ATPase subunit